MQWTREGAHQVLQIRAMMAYNHWEQQWQNTVLSALGAVAWFILAAPFVTTP